MVHYLKSILTILVLESCVASTLAFPSFSSFPASEHLIRRGQGAHNPNDLLPPLPPALLNFTGIKLVDDPAHPWLPTRPGDIRGPCPGLNTLASHGYIPRTGVATPGQILTAVQEGFNLEYSGAAMVLYAAMLVSGNPLTDLLSIGGKTELTGPDPPAPATVAGLSSHNFFEGDGSMTRADVFFDKSQNFNQAKFDIFKSFSNRFGNGYYNITVAAELRNHLIQQGIATNPEFSFIAPRTFAAYIESTLPINLFVDGRHAGTPLQGQLDLNAAESFFKHSRFPKGFHRSPKPAGSDGIANVFGPFPNRPGKNTNGVNTFVFDDTQPMLPNWCAMYTKFVNEIVPGQYPNPTGILRRNLNIYMGYLFNYSFLKPLGCTRVFPYGQD